MSEDKTNLNDEIGKTSPSKKKGSKWIWVLGIIILLIAAISSFGEDSQQQANQPTSGSSTSSTDSKQQVKEEPTFTVNVEGLGKIKGIVVSDVGIAIADVKTANVLGTEFTQTNAQGQFIIVRLVVNNEQKDAITMDSSSFKILDSNGREYSSSSEGQTELMMMDKESFFLKSINPGITTSGYVVFDVPSGLSNLKLQVQGGMTGKKGTLPLQVVKAE